MHGTVCMVTIPKVCILLGHFTLYEIQHGQLYEPVDHADQ